MRSEVNLYVCAPTEPLACASKRFEIAECWRERRTFLLRVLRRSDDLRGLSGYFLVQSVLLSLSCYTVTHTQNNTHLHTTPLSPHTALPPLHTHASSLAAATPSASHSTPHSPLYTLQNSCSLAGCLCRESRLIASVVSTSPTWWSSSMLPWLVSWSVAKNILATS